MKNTALQIAFWLNVILSVYMLLVGVEFMAVLAFIIYSIYTGLMLYAKKDYKVAAIVLSVIMFLVNISLADPSGVDLLIWILNGILVTI